VKPLILGIVFVAAFAAGAYAQNRGEQIPLLVIHRPTILAFCRPVTRSELDADPEANEAVSDFEFYAGSSRARLKNTGVDFREADARSFRLRVGTKVRTFHTGKIGIGYYFIAPGREPHVEYGVMTDEDLADAARKYFGIPIR
jgi:hypothetical protein